MIAWSFMVVFIAIVSYLVDVGVISFLDMKAPVLEASVMSVILMLCGLGMMFRVGAMMKKGARESMRERIEELEALLAANGISVENAEEKIEEDTE
ncbi:MAG: hypothetical protein KAX15_04715 [Candidatus Omnitrophica bacterium]|nr:hypothetical protein [Candidatus Omnitrophota bacterium]